MEERYIKLSEAQLQTLVQETVNKTLLGMGVDAHNPIEMQRDFQHLREWREATGTIQKRGMLVLVSTLVAGGLAATWVGIKQFINV